MKVDKKYCMESYLTVRYVYDEDKCFKDGVYPIKHKEVPLKDKIPCKTAKDIDENIRRQLEKIDLSNAAVLLSGGMDSAILASYMPKGTKCYTTRCIGKNAVDETSRAKQYCDLYQLEHVIVDVAWDDYVDKMDELMLHDGSPIISNEPQAYKAALRAKADGADTIIYGDCADTEFGGMDRLLSKDWSYKEWIDRFTFLNPAAVMKDGNIAMDTYEDYKKGDNDIDFVGYIQGPYAVSAAGALTNAFDCAGLKYVDPYEHLCMAEKLDLDRVRNGESKYLIRDLFKMRYPTLDIPEKLPMSRPAEAWLANWEGPIREEFKEGCVDKINGEQKLLLYSLERFLNLIGA